MNSNDVVNFAMNKKITDIIFDDCNSVLNLYFEDETAIKIYDDGQACCEDRYMTTDDKYSDFIGSAFRGIQIKTADDIPTEDDYYCHEMQFLEIKTSFGEFVMETHNVHNGYYGGF